MTLRTQKTQARYDLARKEGRLNALKDLPSIEEFNYWRLVDNEYPHDKVASVHHMLLPKRVVREFTDLTFAETMELSTIMFILLYGRYGSFKINTDIERTITDHVHIHCLVNI